jgi:hypothetical protein
MTLLLITPILNDSGFLTFSNNITFTSPLNVSENLIFLKSTTIYRISNISGNSQFNKIATRSPALNGSL